MLVTSTLRCCWQNKLCLWHFSACWWHSNRSPTSQYKWWIPDLIPRNFIIFISEPKLGSEHRPNPRIHPGYNLCDFPFKMTIWAWKWKIWNFPMTIFRGLYTYLSRGKVIIGRLEIRLKRRPPTQSFRLADLRLNS